MYHDVTPDGTCSVLFRTVVTVRVRSTSTEYSVPGKIQLQRRDCLQKVRSTSTERVYPEYSVLLLIIHELR